MNASHRIKPRARRAPLLKLSAEQHQKLVGWLTTGTPYHEARVLIEEQFGLKFKTTMPIHLFWKKVCVPELKRQQQERKLPVCPPYIDPASWKALGERVHTAMVDQKTKPDELKTLMMLLYKGGDQYFKARRLDLDREKYEYAAARACMDNLPELKRIAEENPLDDEARLQEVRLLLFGSPPDPQPIQNPSALKTESPAPISTRDTSAATQTAGDTSPLKGVVDQG